ncbi:MAG: YigZ family protein [Clostridiales bacterium]|jgi:uncharacterized YigZ family protein|nr:YigZ family protein [Clostridiales bacterium]
MAYMYLYKSILEYAEAEYVIERSRFIAHASPAGSPEEARLFVSQIKEKYKDATHNVPAFVCGAGMEHQWASDDGEPAGTSGMPVLRLISSRELTNVVVVVTRYFGGIKLGTGGLARAYTHAAGLALDAAGTCEVRDSAILEYSLDYTYLSKLRNLSAEGGFDIADITYTDVVSALIKCPSEEGDRVKSLIADLTGGRAVLKDERADLAKYPCI